MLKLSKIVELGTLMLFTALPLVACNVSKNNNLIGAKENEVDTQGIPKNPNVKKWYDFKKKIDNIAREYFSVQTEIVAGTFGNIGKEWEELIGKPDDGIKPYLTNSEKIKTYEQLQKEYHQLPTIIMNNYQTEINKYFKTLQFWTMYRHFWDHQGLKRKFTEIFNIRNWNNEKQYIMTSNVVINDLFSINWEYKTRKKDPNNDEQWIETYNQTTQTKIFEFIQFHKYIENLYDKYSKQDGIDYRDKCSTKNEGDICARVWFKVIEEYEQYIDMKSYQEWEKTNIDKIGYGVWQEIG